MNFKKVISGPRNNYTEKSIVRICQSLIELDNNSEAAIFLERLEGSAEEKENLIYAASNLMKISFEDKNYNKAVIYGEKLISFKEGEVTLNTSSLRDPHFNRNVAKLISKWTGRIWQIHSSNSNIGSSLSEEDVVNQQNEIKVMKNHYHFHRKRTDSISFEEKDRTGKNFEIVENMILDLV